MSQGEWRILGVVVLLASTLGLDAAAISAVALWLLPVAIRHAKWLRLWHFHASLEARVKANGSKWIAPFVDLEGGRLVWYRTDGRVQWPMSLKPRRISDLELREWITQPGLTGCGKPSVAG